MKFDFQGRRALFGALFPKKQSELMRLRSRLNELEAVEEHLEAERRKNQKLATQISAFENQLAVQKNADITDVEFLTNLLAGKTDGVSLPVLRKRFGNQRALQIARASYDVIFVKSIREGFSISEAAARAVRSQMSWGDAPFPMPLTLALLAHPSTRDAGFLGFGLLLAQRRLFRSALDAFLKANRDEVRRLAWPEFIRVLAYEDEREAASEVALITDRPLEEIGCDQLHSLIGVLYGNGFKTDALDFVEKISRSCSGADSLPNPPKDQLKWFATYEGFKNEKFKWHNSAVESQSPTLAVFDYKQPDISATSSNIGDYIQTIALLGCIARMSNLDIVGHKDLTDVIAKLRRRTGQDGIANGSHGQIALTSVDRDASHDAPPPPGTWVLAFGWHMHKTFRDHLAFPFHPNVRPIFLSFHCNKPEMLGEEGVEYLKRFSPIGCRDWTTVYILRSRGVPAFFSGCITTTISVLFDGATKPSGASEKTAFVDAAPSPRECGLPHKRFAHAHHTFRWDSATSNLQRAIDRLDEYYFDFDRVVTSRLHAYLPCAAMGLEVDFRPGNPADVRFEGLVNLSHDQIAAIRSALIKKITAIVDMIGQGASPEQVYATWAELCREEMAEADSRCTQVPDISLSNQDVASLVAAPITKRIVWGHLGDEVDSASVVHVALAADKAYVPYLCVVLQSILRNSQRPIQLYILTREFEQKHFELVGRRFTSDRCCVQFFPCDAVDYGNVVGMYDRITVSTMDRLLLPEFLPGIERLVYIDIDTVVLGDVGELYDIDLKGYPIAARGSIAPETSRGFAQVIPASVRLRPELAAEFRRRMAWRTDLAYSTFNAGVLVLDLQRLRQVRFCNEFLPYATRYGLHDQELLNCFAGGKWCPLPKGWNAWPTQELVEEPKLVHFVGINKPWMGNILPFSDSWELYRKG